MSFSPDQDGSTDSVEDSLSQELEDLENRVRFVVDQLTTVIPTQSLYEPDDVLRYQQQQEEIRLLYELDALVTRMSLIDAQLSLTNKSAIHH